MTMKQKIVLKHINGAYRVISLENRAAPSRGTVFDSSFLDDLLLEAKINKNLTIKIS